MKKTILAVWTGSILLAAAGLAVAPQHWVFRSADDFLRGRFDGVSVTSDGILTLAQREEKIEGPTEDFFLSFIIAPDGTAYLGTGHSGRIFKITKEGKVESAAQLPEMDVTCLAVDAKGVLYAGTSPNGKIYKIAAQGKATEFFDPSERYIWDLAFADNGTLLAAVGESGGIYEILPEGQGRLIFKAPENHVLCLRLDRNKDIIAGSGGGGLVYRVSRTGKAGVIFETPFEEVRSLALDLDGNIYAAAGGTSSRARRDDLPPDQAGSGRDADVSVSVSAVAAAPPPAAPQAAPQAAPASGRRSSPASAVQGREPGALFRIGPDGVAKRIWASNEDMIYSLYWNETEKKVYFGTGPKGRLFALDKDEKATLVLQKNSEQIYALVPVGVRTYILADNPSQISVLYPDRRLSGEYQSPVLDAKIASSWGRLSWSADLPQGGTLQFQTRSGNGYEPGPGWSDWSPPYQKNDGEQILSSKGRYLQVRALFKAVAGPASPVLSRMSVFYLQTNVAPVISRLDVLAPNEVFLKLPLDQDEVILALERRNPDPAAPKKDDPLRLVVSKKVERKGYQTISWDADDENGDALQYTISIRADGDKAWRVIEDRWPETLYAFNTLNFPDGVYVLKVAASDLPSNPPGLEKRGERITPPLTIDNTAPVLRNVQIARNGAELAVSFVAEDALSAIKDVKYLVRPDDWRMVFPEDGICDAKQESFKFKAPLPAGADGQITIVVKDATGNVLTFKQAF
jgi:hypothetical protein